MTIAVFCRAAGGFALCVLTPSTRVQHRCLSVGSLGDNSCVLQGCRRLCFVRADSKHMSTAQVSQCWFTG